MTINFSRHHFIKCVTADGEASTCKPAARRPGFATFWHEGSDLAWRGPRPGWGPLVQKTTT